MRGTLAAYTRTSIEDFNKAHQLIDESCSIVNQRNIIHDFVGKNEELSKMHQVEFVDDGFTGTNFNRPQFQEMMSAARLGKIQCIVVKDLSRLGRSYLEIGDCLEKLLPSLGVRLIAVTDGYDSQAYAGTTGGIDVAFRNFIYDSYSRDLSKKVKSAMMTRMEKGRYVSHTPYGYMKSPMDKHIMVPDPVTAPVVREIFQMAGAGWKTSEVAKELNRRGTLTPHQYKGHKTREASKGQQQRWSHIMVLNILKNYKYTGAMVNHTRESRMLRDRSQRRTSAEEWIITEDAHEPIVTKAEFEAAHSQLRHPKKCGYRSEKMNTNVFFCGCCGHKLRKTQGVNTYFSCEMPLYLENSPCAGIRWNKTDLDGVLLPVYETQLRLLGEKAAAADWNSTEPDLHSFVRRMGQLEKNIAHYDSEKMRLLEEYLDGEISRESMQVQKRALEAQQVRFREEYSDCEERFRACQQEAERQRQEYQKLMEYRSEGEMPKDAVIEKMYKAIDRVTVFCDHHVEVSWKFSDLFEDQKKTP